MGHQYMPKIFHGPHKNPPPPPSYILHVRSLIRQKQFYMSQIYLLIYNNPDYIIIHTANNNLTKNANSRNHLKKIVKKVKTKSPKTRIVFSGIRTRKDKKGIHKKLDDTNNWLKNYYSQKNLDCNNSTNIKEEHLSMKILYLNKRGNCVFRSNLLS